MKSFSIITAAILYVIYLLLVIPLGLITGFSLAYLINLVFVTISFVISAMVLKKVVESKEPLKSKFYKLPLLIVTRNYFLFSVFASFVLLGVSTLDPVEPFAVYLSLVIHFMILGFSVIGFTVGQASINEIERVQTRVAEKVNFINDILVELKTLERRSSDSEIKGNLKRLIDKVRYSDPMSNQSTSDIESEIIALVKGLSENQDKDAQILSVNAISRLVDERNLKVKVSK